MMYESSYESGRIPFVSDVNRGHWLKTSDFIFASLSLSYRMDSFLLFIQYSETLSVISLLPAFIFSLAFYTVPLMMVQSFMGQFSSSGFISAFRLSPIFKGIGYVSLALNILMLIFYSLFSMIPLVYLLASFSSQLPWSCNGTYSWVDFCDTNSDSRESIDYLDYAQFFQIPSNLYFDNIFHNFNMFGLQLSLSWQLLTSAICVWCIVALVVHTFTKIGQIGQIVRYAVISVIALLILLIVRLSFMPGVTKIFTKMLTPNWDDFIDGLITIPNYGISTFGPGWGLVLTLASFNKFNTNIRYTSWLIGGGHMIMTILYSILELLVKGGVQLLTHESFQYKSKPYLAIYLSGGSVFASMKWANFWSIVFYFMLVLAGVTLMVIQINIILYSIFDEFIALRKNRTQITIGLIGLMGITSLFFVTEYGYSNFLYLRFDTLVTQTLIDLLVILAVLWVYGRQRFQRDLEFMINEPFANWKIYALRFLAPVVLLVTLIESVFVTFFHSLFGQTPITVFNLLLRPLPWLCVPGYAIYCLMKSKGRFTARFLKSARPTDWYPVENDDRRKYEDVINNANMTHPLNVLEDN